MDKPDKKLRVNGFYFVISSTQSISKISLKQPTPFLKRSYLGIICVNSDARWIVGMICC